MARLYRVTTLLALGGGMLVTLDAAQLARRGARVEVLKDHPESDDARKVVRLPAPVQFKVGETLGFVQLPPKGYLPNLEMIAGQEPWPEGATVATPAASRAPARRRGSK